jgi:hypothetical protein
MRFKHETLAFRLPDLVALMPIFNPLSILIDTNNIVRVNSISLETENDRFLTIGFLIGVNITISNGGVVLLLE